MALITCPECGHEISDQAEFCPNCGKPMKVKKEVAYKLNLGHEGEENRLASILRVLAVLDVIGGLILAVVTGNVVQMDRYGYTKTTFSFGTFISTFTPFLVNACLLWAVAQIADVIQRTHDMVKGLALEKFEKTW